MSLVKEVTERSKSSSNAPPAAPTPSQNGFPKVQHRSQRISQFKRARGTATAGPSARPYANEPPVVRSTSEVLKRSGPDFGEREAVGRSTQDLLKDCQDENDAKIASMSRSERDHELGELESMISPDLLAMLRSRAEKKAAMSSGLKEELRPEAVVEPESELDDNSGEQPWTQTLDNARNTLGSSTEPAPKHRDVQPKVRFVDDPAPLPPSTLERETPLDELSPSYIHQRYFPNQAANPAELEWIQAENRPGPSRGAGSSSSPPQTRFDLAGKPLTVEQSEEMAVNKGLHHHGDESGRAGYTVEEVIQLCASTFLPQRTMMLGVLGKILSQRESYTETIRKELDDGKLLKLGIDVIVGVLCSAEKNAGVIREAVSALYASMGSGARSVIEGKGFTDEDVTREPERTAPLTTWVKLLPLHALLDRISGMLDQPIRFSNLSLTSIYQLIGILLITSISSVQASDEVANNVPRLLRNFLSRLEWPRPTGDRRTPDGRAEEAISSLAIRVLRSCTTASKSATKMLLNNGAYDVPLKFLYFAPWSEDATASATDEDAWMFAGLIIDLYEKLARYGLNGTLLGNTSEIWVAFGVWVSRRDPKTDRPEKLYAIRAYFNLLRIWLVSAKDPHSMEHEHDLIWTQISGYGWQDEAEHVLGALWPLQQPEPSRSIWDTATSALGVLIAWIKGCELNHERNGIDDKTALRSMLRAMDPLQSLETILVKVIQPQGTRPLESVMFAARLLELVRILDFSTFAKPGHFDLVHHLDAILDFQPTPQPQAINVLAYQMLMLHDAASPMEFARFAISIIEAARPGEEDHVMQLVDKLLDLGWPSEMISQIGHRHGLYILRPFLHYGILPDLETLTTPETPLSNMLRATATLRTCHRAAKATEGLPLRSDWLYIALEQYMRRESSGVFKQLPPAWDASRLEMVRATLVLGSLLQGFSRRKQNRSVLMLNAMKVFLLESARDLEAEDEIFRDAVVSSLLSEMVQPCLKPEKGLPETRLDEVSMAITPADTTFLQIYGDFVQLYDAMSLSDVTFSQLLLVPTSQAYPIDYRQLVWSEQPSVLRSVRLSENQVLLETGSLEAYYEPHEEDPDMLFAYLQALARQWVTKVNQPFLYKIAIHHLGAALKRDIKDVTTTRLIAGIERDLNAEVKSDIQS